MKLEKEIRKPRLSAYEAMELIAGKAISIYGCIILHIAGAKFQFAGTQAAINKAIAALTDGYITEE